MRKPALYSPSPRPLSPGPASRVIEEGAQPKPAAAPERWHEKLGRVGRLNGLQWLAMFLLAVGVWASASRPWQTPKPALTQKDVDAAVLHTLATHALPSAAVRAAEKIRPSVVQVTALVKNRKGEEVEVGLGTGVVIVDRGLILTNFHVVKGAQAVRVAFADGSESLATVKTVQVEHDLAVLQASTAPDDLKAATLRPSTDLKPGTTVLAVGFPFGIGPSVSLGVVSGLNREFKAPQGEQELGNLIQFDAAANPGNSGGPLVTLDGEVVGIVTGILNPTSHRTFVGIGFAVPIESAAAAAGMPPF